MRRTLAAATTGLRMVSNLLWMDSMPLLFVVVFENYTNWLVKLLHRTAADKLSTKRLFIVAVLKNRQHLMVGTQMSGTWAVWFGGALIVCRVSQPRHSLLPLNHFWICTLTLPLWKAEKKKEPGAVALHCLCGSWWRSHQTTYFLFSRVHVRLYYYCATVECNTPMTWWLLTWRLHVRHVTTAVTCTIGHPCCPRRHEKTESGLG